MRNFLRIRRYSVKGGRSGWSWLWIGLSVLAIAIIAAAIGFYIWYSSSLAPVSNSKTTQLFTVDDGSSAHQIADGLKSLGLIRSPSAFILYIDVHNYRGKLQAGTYKFNPSLSARVIAGMMARGEIDKNWITILPGKRLDQIKQVFKQVGYSDSQISSAFSPATYSDEPLVAKLPAGASLEGLLYPDSFQRAPSTPASAIVRESIEEMQSKLTPDIINGFKQQGLTPYQGITLSSIVYQESGSSAEEPEIAQVFLLRLKDGMRLQSNVTADYAADIAGQPRSVSINSPYNTYLHDGLPPGPISNMTSDALEAVAHPASTNYLFFVVGKDCAIHFSHTQQEHDAAIQKYGLGCGQ